MKVLVISVHPDDETLGSGGTLLKHQAAGNRLFWLIVTQPYEPQWTQEVIQRKAEEVKKVTEAYGMEECFKLVFPATQLDKIPQAELIQSVQGVVSKLRPEVVYLVNGGDVHTDHQVVFTATMSLLKPAHMARFGIRRMLCYETLSSTDAAPPRCSQVFFPNVFNDITSHLERKIEIMSLYETEAQADPLPRGPSAIRALARYRGATIGVEFAEAFMLIRQLM